MLQGFKISISCNRIMNCFFTPLNEKILICFKDITLVTQCSINHLHHLVDLVKVWNGPISCSIFVPNLVSIANIVRTNFFIWFNIYDCFYRKLLFE